MVTKKVMLELKWMSVPIDPSRMPTEQIPKKVISGINRSKIPTSLRNFGIPLSFPWPQTGEQLHSLNYRLFRSCECSSVEILSCALIAVDSGQ